MIELINIEFFRSVTKLAVNYLSVIFLYFLGLANASGQNLVSTDELLFGDSILFTELSEDLLEVTQMDGSMPMVDKLEFRTETEKWDIGAQEYLFRTSFNSKKERKVLDEIHILQSEALQLRIYKYQESRLYDRYMSIVNWKSIEDKLQLLKKSKVLLEDIITVQRRLLENEETSVVNDLLKSNQDLINLSIEIGRAEFDRDALINELIGERYPNKDTRLNADDWLSIERINTIAEELIRQPMRSEAVIIQNNRLDRELLEFELNLAEKMKIFDFAQVKYAERGGDNFAEEWSIGVGLNIPVKSTKQQELYANRLEIIDEKIKLESVNSALEIKRKNLLCGLQSLKFEYDKLEEELSNGKLNQTFESLKHVSDVSPLLLLQIKEMAVDIQLTKQAIASEMYRKYIDLLYVEGCLLNNIDVNYLTAMSVVN